VIGLSVAVGRFVEALFWAMLRAGAPIALGVAGITLALLALWSFVKRRRG